MNIFEIATIVGILVTSAVLTLILIALIEDGWRELVRKIKRSK